MDNSKFDPNRSGSASTPEKKIPGWAWAAGIVLIIGLLWVVGTIIDFDQSSESETVATATTTPTTTKPQLTDADREKYGRQAQERAAAASASQAAAAEASRQAAAAAQAAKMDPSTYERIDEHTFAEIVRNADAHKNRKIVIYGNVVQADAGTGTSRFRANTAATQYWNWYDFDQNAIISANDPALVSRVLEDDLVEMFVEVKGALSYSTTLGGETTAPEFTVNMLNVYGSD